MLLCVLLDLLLCGGRGLVVYGQACDGRVNTCEISRHDVVGREIGDGVAE